MKSLLLVERQHVFLQTVPHVDKTCTASLLLLLFPPIYCRWKAKKEGDSSYHCYAVNTLEERSLLLLCCSHKISRGSEPSVTNVFSSDASGTHANVLTEWVGINWPVPNHINNRQMNRSIHCVIVLFFFSLVFRSFLVLCCLWCTSIIDGPARAVEAYSYISYLAAYNCWCCRP